MLQLEKVTKRYQTKAGAVEALKEVSLTFPTTGLVFITGKSGCGKTTLLNVIGGLDGIDGGEIFVQDKRFSTFSAEEYDSYRNTFIGFIFQEYNLLPEFTVEQNIKIAMELQGRVADEEEFETLLEDVGIEEFKDRFPSELSGGQRQRVAIARALVKHPRIIMADEPTGALDSDTGVQVLDTLKRLSKHTLVIVVSHDREFAERYADRIIHLIDGQIAQDVTFTENEMRSNACLQGDTLVIREGSDLSEEEKNLVAKAVKERKGIEIVENLSFREKNPTGVVVRKEEEPVALRKSQMKMRSAMHLGVKSLVVKPWRLVITILISAIAFAVFGLFDTIANFSTASVLKNQLKISFSDTIVTNANYTVDYEEGDRYDIKLSQNVVKELQSKTGGVVKGIFDLYDNTQGGVKQTFSITQLLSSSITTGKKYYANTINGFVEFSRQTEILQNDKFKDFDYKIIAGKYPTLGKNESPYQVAISTYLADSIMHYLNGAPLNEKEVGCYEDFLNAMINVDGRDYLIVGIIDCGKIPTKYDALKTATFNNTGAYALGNDFDSYINSCAHKCLFVAEGFLNAVRAETNKADKFQIGNTTWTLGIEGSSTTKSVSKYAYATEGHGQESILLFSGEYSNDGKISLADDEVLIHSLNLENLFATQLSNLPTTERNSVLNSIRQLSKADMQLNRTTLQTNILQKLNITETEFAATIYQRNSSTGEKVSTKVKIMGVYCGLDTDAYVTPYTYKFMMSKNLMEEMGVFSEQGEYTKLLFSEKSLRKGMDVVVDYLLAEEGLTLTWYNNSALNIILENETMIRQVADLFLYAAIALSVFSIFMLYNYISVSISSKKQSVGVLRGLGACGKDILLTFLSESIIVAVVNGIFANIFAKIGCSFVNMYIVKVMNISVHFALFGSRQILIIAVVSLLTAILASSLPIVKISKKKPIELIRRP